MHLTVLGNMQDVGDDVFTKYFEFLLVVNVACDTSIEKF